MSILLPASESEAMSLVRECAARKTSLRIEGGGTRKAGHAGAGARLSTCAMAGVTLYEPSEMVLSALPGTPLSEIEALVAARNQILPFEPADPRFISGDTGTPTIGGAVAVNASGPRRIKTGALRDSLIGVRFINGRGEVIRSGGRVMKNVTGLDLVKLQAGAHGTLGLLTEMTFKLLPAPEVTGGLVFHGLCDRDGVALLCKAMGTPFEVSGAAHVPGYAGKPARTVLRVEGLSHEVAYRLKALEAVFADFSPERLEDAAARAAFSRLSNLSALEAPLDAALWKISVKPTAGPDVLAAMEAAGAINGLYDWSGGLVWIAMPEEVDGDAGAARLRRAIAASGGGHATLLRGSADLRARVHVFEPMSAGVAAMTRAVKASIDPQAIFNPGLMYAGI